MSQYLRIDREKLLQSIFQDEEILKEICHAFRDDALRLHKVLAAAEAEGSFPEAGEAMHALKGVLGSVMAFRESREAEFLEKRFENPQEGDGENLWKRGKHLFEELPEIQEELRLLLEEIRRE